MDRPETVSQILSDDGLEFAVSSMLFASWCVCESYHPSEAAFTTISSHRFGQLTLLGKSMEHEATKPEPALQNSVGQKP